MNCSLFANLWRWALVLFLAMVCLDRHENPLAAATTSAGGSRKEQEAGLPANCPCQLVSPTTSSRLLFAAWTDGIIGNRDRMIQVTFVTIAIGIFFLSRSTK